MDLFKRELYRNKKITQSANGQTCTLRLDGCLGGTETTVWAHSPYSEDGKGGAQKADDIFGCYACQHCHDLLDKRKYIDIDDEFIRDRFHSAMKVSIRRLIDLGILS